MPAADAAIGPGRTLVLNDASEPSPTLVVSHLTITSETPPSTTDRLRAAIAEARSTKRPVIASTARHSMGGQSLAAGGTVATLDQQWLASPCRAPGSQPLAARDLFSSVRT